MKTTSIAASPGLVRAIVKAGALAGTLDIIAACSFYAVRTGKSPLGVLELVASGVYGSAAFSDNDWMAPAGLLIHYCIAYGWSSVFFIAYPKVALLGKNTLASGIFYGIFVWCMMNLVVLPLSRVQVAPFNPGRAAVGALILVLCIGMPISILARRYHSRR